MRVEENEMHAVSDGRVVVPIGPPETRPAAPITPGTITLGERVVWCAPDGWHFDLRATSNPHTRDDGQLVVDIVAEAAWYAWQLNGTTPAPVSVLATVVFVERPHD